MNILKNELLKEIPRFREIGHRFIKKEISSLEFKSSSGGMGVYSQRGGEKFMIRLRIPSGIMNLDKLKIISNLAISKGLEFIHLTSRQAIQFHDISIDDICDVMKEALEKDIYTRGGGGNFPRNVSISPLSGLEQGEAFDVTSYAMEVNNYFINKITSYKLPRKLKVSFSNGDSDSGNSTIADLGFLAVIVDGNKYFKVYLGGGLGKNGSKSVEYDELIEPKDVLYHVEAITNLFVAEGDYENKNKARIRYILKRLGKEEFINCYKKHLNEVKNTVNLNIDINDKSYDKQGIDKIINNKRIISQKQKGLYSVYYHPISGQLQVSILKDLINILENFRDIEIRLSMTEGMYISNLNGLEVEEVIKLTENKGGETCLEQSISCVGAPKCQIGIANSQSTLNEIIEYFNSKNYTSDILPKIHISGCGNSCGTHQVSLLGLAGKKKRIGEIVEEAFELHIGGKTGNNVTVLGTIYGDIARKNLPIFLYELSLDIDKSNLNYEEYIKDEGLISSIINKYKI